ncbi:MAG: hypothetical protein HUU38_23660 [Anaerolineales bacterium]|jgi:hypothetical protein|nr:hypothetical protein [Anaerolineales bacterium]
MVEMIVQVPEGVAARLAPVQEQLPDILELVTGEGVSLSAQAYDEVLGFLATNPTSKNVVSFRLSKKLQQAIQQLQARHSEGQTTSFEKAELHRLLRIEHQMRAIKLQALERLPTTSH